MISLQVSLIWRSQDSDHFFFFLLIRDDDGDDHDDHDDGFMIKIMVPNLNKFAVALALITITLLILLY